jgi:uncharacterized hydrophobic protein (TIGR00271 family)
MDITTTEKTEAIKLIIANSKLDRSYLVINATASIVACSGLMADSTAVVIGSMLIATLLSPIAIIALALTDKNTKGILQGLKTLIIGVLLVMSIAYSFGLLFPHIQATHRMLARTDPGVFDFIIAFFGGLAGAISLLFKRYNSVIIGVGIATALVPPLSTGGIFFAKANYDLGLKAFELALINITFILIANFIVFKYFKLTSRLNH